MDYLEK